MFSSACAAQCELDRAGFGASARRESSPCHAKAALLFPRATARTQAARQRRGFRSLSTPTHIVFGSPPRSKTDFTGAASQRVPFPASSPHPIAPALLRLPEKYNTRSRAVMLSGVSCRWIARRLVRSRSHSCPRCTTPNVMQSLYDVFMLREFTELDICVHPVFRLPIRHDLPFVLCKRNNVMQSANAVACLTRARYHLPGRSYTL